MHRPLSIFLAASLVTVASCSGGSDAVTIDTAADTSTSETPDTRAPVETAAPATDPVATDAPVETTEAPVETDPPAPEPAAFTAVGLGGYSVGVQTIELIDPTRDRALTVDVTFPLAGGETGDPQRYTFVTGDYYESPQAVAAIASQIAPDGPFPLVVYSHGSGGLRYIDADYTETLASHGYVVVAADHLGNTAVDRFLGAEDDRATVAYDRPRDIQFLIDELTNPESEAAAGFVASVDPERIAVTGHSLGGYGTLAVAGGMSNEVGTIEPDGRVDAVIPLAPAIGDGTPETSLLVAEQLARVTAPMLVLVGSDDTTTPPSPNVDRAVAEVSSPVVYRVDLAAAEHQSFTDVCDYLEFFPTLEPPPTPAVVEIIEAFAVEGCSPGDMDIDRVEEITNTFAVSFLDSVFKGGEMITPDNTEIPGDVEFTAS